MKRAVMHPKPLDGNVGDNLMIMPFQWENWNALWQLLKCHLAEQGILEASIPSHPDPESQYDRDTHHNVLIYFCSVSKKYEIRLHLPLCDKMRP